MYKFPDINSCLDLKPILLSAQGRKHQVIKYDEYNQIERIYIDCFFECNPKIYIKKWTTWSIANDAKNYLKQMLRKLGYIILRPQPEEGLHPYKTTQQGFRKVSSIEKKIKLEKKLQKLHENTKNNSESIYES